MTAAFLTQYHLMLLPAVFFRGSSGPGDGHPLRWCGMMGWNLGRSQTRAVSVVHSKYQTGMPTTKCPGCTQSLEQSTLGWELSDGKISWHVWFLMVANSQAACEAGLPDTAVLWRWKQTLPYTGT